MFLNTSKVSPPRTPPGLFSFINFDNNLQNSSQRDLSKDFKLEDDNDLKKKLYYFIKIYLEGYFILNIMSDSSIPFLINEFGNNYSINVYDELIKKIEVCNNPSNSSFFNELNKRIANDNIFKKKTLRDDFSQLYINNNYVNNNYVNNNSYCIWDSGFDKTNGNNLF